MMFQVPRQYLEEVPDSVTDPERRVYLAMLAAMDRSVGDILQTLRQTGQYDNTLVVFTTDNGGSVGHSASNFPLRGTKGTLWEGGTRAVTFLHSPLLATRDGTLIDGLFHIVDWTPTLASIAGVSQERINQLNLDGKNQKDFILNQGKSVRSEFVYNIKTAPFKVRLALKLGRIWKIMYNVAAGGIQEGKVQTPLGGTRQGRLVRGETEPEAEG